MTDKKQCETPSGEGLSWPALKAVILAEISERRRGEDPNVPLITTILDVLIRESGAVGGMLVIGFPPAGITEWRGEIHEGMRNAIGIRTNAIVPDGQYPEVDCQGNNEGLFAYISPAKGRGRLIGSLALVWRNEDEPKARQVMPLAGWTMGEFLAAAATSE